MNLDQLNKHSGDYHELNVVSTLNIFTTDVLSTIKGLKVRRAVGIDVIPSFIIKLVAENLLPFLHHF